MHKKKCIASIQNKSVWMKNTTQTVSTHISTAPFWSFEMLTILLGRLLLPSLYRVVNSDEKVYFKMLHWASCFTVFDLVGQRNVLGQGSDSLEKVCDFFFQHNPLLNNRSLWTELNEVDYAYSCWQYAYDRSELCVLGVWKGAVNISAIMRGKRSLECWWLQL